MALTEYKRKRDFKKTREPVGKPVPKKIKGASRFVIQKHAARRLHYDFRLEMEGVLKSWAVPKGLPWKKGEKHLAVEVEDHPIEYEEFEGVIPEGNYGGGTVMVWESSTRNRFRKANCISSLVAKKPKANGHSCASAALTRRVSG